MSNTVLRLCRLVVSLVSLTLAAQSVGTTSAVKTVTVTNHQSVALSLTSIAFLKTEPDTRNRV